jgi:NAD(P)-dependent dehydrogenase (short-subunit alcohol dehydrogenase family)
MGTLLQNKNAVIYGAGGAVGGAVARAFAREGAKVFLAGRTLEKLDEVAKEIRSAGGAVETAQVDTLVEEAVDMHMSAMVSKAGGLDISFNATGIAGAFVAEKGLQGTPLVQMSLENFLLPIVTYTRSNFLTARAAARVMVKKGSGVILMHTPEPARLGVPTIGGMGPAWAAMESLSRNLSAEYGSQGIRAICLRSTGMPETPTIDFVFDVQAKAMGVTREQFQSFMEGMTHRRRSTKLEEVANAAVFAASDLGSGLTGTVLNLTGGIVD